MYIDDHPQNVKSYCVDDLISDGNRFPFIKSRTVIVVKISCLWGGFIGFGSHYSVDLAMFCAEMENRFPNKWRNGYTALVIIEAIQIYRILAGRGARAGENDVDNQ
ncbi:hypothetical protein [Klebsiella quasipneumoniae]|uniref:hypothetical protein n=1 Tax=Klebsiella quasipneumoniae TaxID=1463165 RepID=UPI0021BFEC4A|nr:hypothetical protein [Klebsiella quasipneumoniae]MCT8891326.1 hypothetical protein [Klebsiella quasipneumoniae subsp. similipneumoniae]